jgi:hypothetical protein
MAKALQSVVVVLVGSPDAMPEKKVVNSINCLKVF